MAPLSAVSASDQSDPRWAQLISAVLAAGFTQAQIAARIGCSQQNVSALERGIQQELSFKRGRALLTLHAAVVPKATP